MPGIVTTIVSRDLSAMIVALAFLSTLTRGI